MHQNDVMKDIRMCVRINKEDHLVLQYAICNVRQLTPLWDRSTDPHKQRDMHSHDIDVLYA